MPFVNWFSERTRNNARHEYQQESFSEVARDENIFVGAALGADVILVSLTVLHK